MKQSLLNILRKLFPRQLWTPSFCVAAAAGFVTFLTFDLLWCYDTTFRSMSFAGGYLSAALAALLMAMPAALCPRHRWAQLVVWLVVDAWLIANLMYCRTYFSWLSLDCYALVGNVMDFTESITDSLRWRDILLPLTAIGAYMWLRLRPDSKASAEPSPRHKAYWLTLLAAFGVMTAYALCRGGMRADIEDLSQECYYSTSPAVIYTPAGPVLAEIFTPDEVLTPEDKALVDNWLAYHEKLQQAYTPSARSPRTSMVVIFCESLESWVIESRIDNGDEITPYLNSLLRTDSTVLYAPQVVSQADRGRSIDAQLLVMAGMLPMQKKVYAFKAPDNHFFTLPKALKEAHGASTMLLTPDKPITWNQKRVADAFGIDRLISHDSWRMEEAIGSPAKLGDGALMRQTVEKMRDGLWPEGEPAYVHILTYSGHNPFRLPDNLKTLRPGSAYPERMADYMSMAAYTDRSLRTLVDYLKSRSDYKDMLIVIIGDHEGLGSYRSEWLRNSSAARILSRDPLVPMIVLNSPIAGQIDYPIGEVDVYSTLLDLMGLHTYQWQGMGLSALHPSHPRAAIDARQNIIGTPPDSLTTHLKQARRVADRILTFDLLK